LLKGFGTGATIANPGLRIVETSVSEHVRSLAASGLAPLAIRYMSPGGQYVAGTDVFAEDDSTAQSVESHSVRAVMGMLIEEGTPPLDATSIIDIEDLLSVEALSAQLIRAQKCKSWVGKTAKTLANKSQLEKAKLLGLARLQVSDVITIPASLTLNNPLHTRGKASEFLGVNCGIADIRHTRVVAIKQANYDFLQLIYDVVGRPFYMIPDQIPESGCGDGDRRILRHTLVSLDKNGALCLTSTEGENPETMLHIPKGLQSKVDEAIVNYCTEHHLEQAGANEVSMAREACERFMSSKALARTAGLKLPPELAGAEL